MKKIFLMFSIIFGSLYTKAQIREVSTSPEKLIKQLPRFSEISKISKKTINYTPPLPDAAERAITSKTEYRVRPAKYGDIIPVNISTKDGNITNTSALKLKGK